MCEASEDIHTLITILVECRVRTLALRGELPGLHQLGLEVTHIRRRLSAAVAWVTNSGLLGRISQGREEAWPAKEEKVLG